MLVNFLKYKLKRKKKSYFLPHLRLTVYNPNQKQHLVNECTMTNLFLKIPGGLTRLSEFRVNQERVQFGGYDHYKKQRTLIYKTKNHFTRLPKVLKGYLKHTEIPKVNLKNNNQINSKYKPLLQFFLTLQKFH